jgi:hypothetical protein
VRSLARAIEPDLLGQLPTAFENIQSQCIALV